MEVNQGERRLGAEGKEGGVLEPASEHTFGPKAANSVSLPLAESLVDFSWAGVFCAALQSGVRPKHRTFLEKGG